MKTATTFIFLFLLSLSVFGNKPVDDSTSPLFSSSEPLFLVLEMDMEKVLNDKSDDPEYNTALLIRKMSDGNIQAFNIKIKARGNTRRIKDVCEFPPLKLNFIKSETNNTVFDGQDKIKMVTHCMENPDYENFAILEYLVYKTYNLLTENSFQVRLVHVTYKDVRQSYKDIVKTGFLIEDADQMAVRIGGSISDKKIWSPDSCNQASVDMFSLFQFMIGNTDWWIHKRHNVDIVSINDELFPVPYDFDYAGIVNPPYAIPSPSLSIVEVKDRFFKGSCKSIYEYQDAIATFNTKKSEIIGMLEETDLMNKKFKRLAVKYIESFYEIINEPPKFSQFINQTCTELYHIPGQANAK
jgi:hypothetical protein